MSSLSKFDFCPKCGALARDGVCQSCGYVNPASVPKQPVQQPQPQQGWQAQQPQQSWQGQQQNVSAFQNNGNAGFVAPPQDSYNQYQYQAYNNPALQKPQKNNNALVIILVMVVIILGLLFTCCAGSLGMYMLDIDVDSLLSEESKSIYPWEEDDEEEEVSKSYEGSDKKYAEPSKEVEEEKESSTATSSSEEEEMTKPTQDLEGLAEGKYYEAPYNALRDDLIYGIDFETGQHIPEQYDGRVTIQVEYPQLTGAAPNLDIINAYLEREYSYFYDYFVETYEPYITEESIFYVVAQGYVTYMDEEVLSVVFHEELYIDGESMIQYYCLNFDMTDGVILNNVDILNLDLDFAIEFRRREIIENGDEWLTDYTDQEILEMLKDIDHLVIFYTPMGMEVGLNLYDVVLYMTYSDYEKFLKLY
ncbi:MAG: hypothetical protein IJW63_11355 [Lachnospiraceae bacterium]|nr:hypothetical protein [Lachnospiraceae bacterium]